MSKFWKWFLIVIIALVVLGVIAIAVVGFTRGFGHMGYFVGRRGGFMMIPGMERGFLMHGAFPGRPGLMLFGLFRFFGLLIPLGLLALLVWALVKLTSKKNPVSPMAASSPSPENNPANAAPVRVCSHCGKTAQADWVTCPYCGEKL